MANAPPPSFQTRDPDSPEFWSERFAQAYTPWDKGGVPQALREFVAAAPRPLVTLIPGCGSGHEVACLAEAGWDVTAIDFAPEAVRAARASLGPFGERVVLADFFHYEPPHLLECIYERAFLCALPPRRHAAIAQRWAELLEPGGLLCGYFLLEPTEKGPPFGIHATDLEALLAPNFERLADAAVSDSLPVFAGRERWQLWRRRG